MEKYLGYSKETIKSMIRDRQTSLNQAIEEMFSFPKDRLLYRRVACQAAELAELVNEWAFRNDDIIEFE